MAKSLATAALWLRAGLEFVFEVLAMLAFWLAQKIMGDYL